MVRDLVRVVLLCCLISLAGCDRQRDTPVGLPDVPVADPARLDPGPAPEPDPEAIPEPAPDLGQPAVAPTEPPVPADAIALVVAFEIVSPGYYRAHLLRPIWPGGASGATIGVGYDLGHQIAHVIREDWTEHQRVEDLAEAALVAGDKARALVVGMRDIETGYPLAEQVFRTSTVPRYWQATRRAFPGIDDLAPGARGALFSVAYNRGTAMAGSRRTEMREIRDRCVPDADYQCIAEQILAMRRLWRGTSIEAGMNRRREAEAELALTRPHDGQQTVVAGPGAGDLRPADLRPLRTRGRLPVHRRADPGHAPAVARHQYRSRNKPPPRGRGRACTDEAA